MYNHQMSFASSASYICKYSIILQRNNLIHRTQVFPFHYRISYTAKQNGSTSHINLPNSANDFNPAFRMMTSSMAVSRSSSFASNLARFSRLWSLRR